jgi:hypothetical protein
MASVTFDFPTFQTSPNRNSLLIVRILCSKVSFRENSRATAGASRGNRPESVAMGSRLFPVLSSVPLRRESDSAAEVV